MTAIGHSDGTFVQYRFAGRRPERCESEADRLRKWLGETRRVMPRFSTPLVKELAAETTGLTPRSRRGPRQTQKLPPG